MFLILLLIITSVIVASSREVFSCTDVGDCLYCDKNEMDEDYCKETGKRMKQVCVSDKNEKITDYKSCAKTRTDDQFEVVAFQLAMAVVGGFAYWGVQARKQSQMTLFENRKQRVQRV